MNRVFEWLVGALMWIAYVGYTATQWLVRIFWPPPDE